jgi:hypothetical protein
VICATAWSVTGRTAFQAGQLLKRNPALQAHEGMPTVQEVLDIGDKIIEALKVLVSTGRAVPAVEESG